MQEKESTGILNGCSVRTENSSLRITIILVTEFSVCTSQPLKILIILHHPVQDQID